MSRTFGAIRQIAFIVHDLDAALRYWTETLGVGPFFVLRRSTPGDYRYRGKPSPAPCLSVALGNSGDVQVEIIQQQPPDIILLDLQMPRPTGQKSHHRGGDRPLPLTPGNMLDNDPMHRTFHPSGRIQKVGLDAPQRHEEPPALRQPIVTRRGPATGRTFAPNALVGGQGDLNAPGLFLMATEPDLLVNKTRKTLNPVQDRLNFQLHRWSSGLTCSIAAQNDWITEDQLFFHWRRAILWCGSGDRALQECNPSTGTGPNAITLAAAPVAGGALWAARKSTF